jgi:hypothetical protein
VTLDPVCRKQQQDDHRDKMSNPQEIFRGATPAYGEPKSNFLLMMAYIIFDTVQKGDDSSENREEM